MNWSDRELEAPPAQSDPGMAPNENAFEEKPTKAIIGLGVLIALSLVLYQVNTSQSVNNGSQTMAHRQISSPSPQ